MYFRKFLPVVASLFLVGGCASTFELPLQQVNYDKLYLRGVFTWWEADENYRVQKVSDDVYKASAKLIADGQPYDFKFADVDWSPGLACGPATGNEQSMDIGLGNVEEANCDNPKANFKFTPDETGIFDFFIDFSDPYEPEVYVKRSF